LYLRAILVWLLLLVVAIANGAIREKLFIPRFGERPAHVISAIALSALIFGISLVTIGWLAPPDRSAAFLIGGEWLCLTLAFEFLGGHYVFRAPWSKLLADYDVRRGRIWLLVLASTALAPFLSSSLRAL